MDNKVVNIPIFIIHDLLDNKVYSKSDALIDILFMADENGELYTTIRKLMERWGWGSGRTVSYLKELESRNIIGTQTEHKRNTLIRINKGVIGIVRNIIGTQTEHKRNTNKGHETIKTADALRMILDAWNELAAYGIEPIPEFGISSSQYSNLTILAKTYSVTDILQTIEKIKSSDFLQGNTGYGWKISFDWFLKVGNYKKISSGMYNNNSKAINPSKYKDKNKFNQFQQNDYDFEQLEKDLPSN